MLQVIIFFLIFLLFNCQINAIENKLTININDKNIAKNDILNFINNIPIIKAKFNQLTYVSGRNIKQFGEIIILKPDKIYVKYEINNQNDVIESVVINQDLMQIIDAKTHQISVNNNKDYKNNINNLIYFTNTDYKDVTKFKIIDDNIQICFKNNKLINNPLQNKEEIKINLILCFDCKKLSDNSFKISQIHITDRTNEDMQTNFILHTILFDDVVNKDLFNIKSIKSFN